MPGQQCLNHLLKDLEGLCADDGLPVDDERRSGLDAKLTGAVGFLLHDTSVSSGIETFVERRGVQTEFFSKELQVLFVERAAILAVLLLEEVIVVLPESILFSRALAGFTGPLRFRAEESEVDVTKSYQPLVNVFFFDLTPRASGKTPAERSLEIAEFDDRDRRVGAAAEVARHAGDSLHQCLLLCGAIRVCCGRGEDGDLAGGCAASLFWRRPAVQQRSAVKTGEEPRHQHEDRRNRRRP